VHMSSVNRQLSWGRGQVARGLEQVTWAESQGAWALWPAEAENGTLGKKGATHISAEGPGT